MEASGDDRLRVLEARSAIARTIALYGQLLDDKRFDEFGDLFTVDAEWSVAGLSLEGRTRIVEVLRELERGEPGWVKHLAFEPVIDVDGDDRARGWSDLLALYRTADGWRLSSAGRYYDTFALEAGRWRFASRRADVVPASALAGFVPGWSEDATLPGPLPPPPPR